MISVAIPKLEEGRSQEDMKGIRKSVQERTREIKRHQPKQSHGNR